MVATVQSASVRELRGSMELSDDLCAPGFVRTIMRGIEIETQPRSLSLKCVLEGEEVYETRDTRLLLRAGDLALIGANQKVSFATPKGSPSTGVSVFFPAELQRLAGDSIAALCGVPAMRITGACVNLESQTEALARLSSNPANASAAGRVMTELMHAVVRALSDIASVSQSVPARKNRTRRDVATRLLRARTFMLAHACARRPVDEIAACYGFSRYNFARLFKNAFGISPRSFLEEARTRIAADLIATTTSPFPEIAARVGYPDYPTFSKAFSRRCGHAPAEWRKRAQTDMAARHRAP